MNMKKLIESVIYQLANMKCFPECVTDGLPKISFPRGEHRSDNNVFLKCLMKFIGKPSIKFLKYHTLGRGILDY